MPHVEIPEPYAPFAKYRHMRPEDTRIWHAFVLANPQRFDRVWYDHKVGDHRHHGDDCDLCHRTGWYDLTRWAVDVVAEDKEKIYIIEIKPSANAKAIGQALAYSKLFIQEYPHSKPIVPVVLTDHIIPNTEKTARALGVLLWTP